MIVVWYNPSKDIYYYKTSKGTYKKYKVNDKNQYDHKVVLIIEDIFINKTKKVPLKKMVLTKIISFLQKIEKK